MHRLLDADPVFELHRGGKMEIRSTVPLPAATTSSLAYTPGVAQVSEAIAADPALAARLHLGGPTSSPSSPTAPPSSGWATSARAAAMPVMEGKAVLFKQFGGVDAVPICLDTQDTDEIVATVERAGAVVRRHQPGGHQRAALLRDRAAAGARR